MAVGNMRHCKDIDWTDPVNVRVDRRTPWGNPFKLGVHGGREEVVEKYRVWMERLWSDLDAEQITRLARLHGNKVLWCWCAPRPCHADVLAEFAERAHSLLTDGLEV